MKAELLQQLLGGRDVADLDDTARVFAADVIARHLRAEAVELADWHRTQGHRLVIVSASLAVYLRPIAEHLRFDAVLATELEVGDDGRLTGAMQGANVRGPEKARRLDAWIAPRAARRHTVRVGLRRQLRRQGALGPRRPCGASRSSPRTRAPAPDRRIPLGGRTARGAAFSRLRGSPTWGASPGVRSDVREAQTSGRLGLPATSRPRWRSGCGLRHSDRPPPERQGADHEGREAGHVALAAVHPRHHQLLRRFERASFASTHGTGMTDPFGDHGGYGEITSSEDADAALGCTRRKSIAASSCAGDTCAAVSGRMR